MRNQRRFPEAVSSNHGVFGLFFEGADVAWPNIAHLGLAAHHRAITRAWAVACASIPTTLPIPWDVSGGNGHPRVETMKDAPWSCISTRRQPGYLWKCATIRIRPAQTMLRIAEPSGIRVLNSPCWWEWGSAPARDPVRSKYTIFIIPFLNAHICRVTVQTTTVQ